MSETTLKAQLAVMKAKACGAAWLRTEGGGA